MCNSSVKMPLYRRVVKKETTGLSKILRDIIIGIVLIIVPVLIVCLDPVHTIVNYNLRLHIGSTLSSILQIEQKAAHMKVYLFNVTNPHRFQAGEDEKLHVVDVGPFVYQEYRWWEGLEENENGTTMAMSPKFRTEFVPEESIGDPKEMNLNLLNLPMLSSAAILTEYPSLVHMVFNTMIAQLNAKAIMDINVHDYLWGYKNPIITMGNGLFPGLVYYESVGLLDRLYDNQSDYKIIVGATTEDRFRIKSVTKRRRMEKGGVEDIEITNQTFTHDTYEGTGFPADMTPELPINLYRSGVCKTFELEYRGRRAMEYGGEGLVYTLSNRSFSNQINPLTKEMYHEGLMDLSECSYNVPFVISNAHYLDADPKLLDYVDGLKPNRTIHASEIVIDRRVGVVYKTKMALQLNLVLHDISSIREVKRFSNLVVPVVRLTVDQPRMSDNTMLVFYLVYFVSPYALIILEAVLAFVGLLLLARASRSIYHNWTSSKGITFEVKPRKILTETPSGEPLLCSKENI